VCLLNTEQFDTLILCGDILDLWLEPNIHNIVNSCQPLVLNLRRVSETHRVIWVIGNHEMLSGAPQIKQMRQFLPRAEIVDHFVLPMGVQQALVVHGHEIENKLVWLGRFLLKLNILIWDLLGIDVQKWARSRKQYKNRYRKLQDSYAAKQCLARYAHLILGHTHVPVSYIAPCQVRVTNTGDWVWHNSYVTVADNMVTLHGGNK
jgi:UDP-2,3-diacylglucosamine pyrophosphatase LpxH